MQITILGATGLVGKELLTQALERDFKVKTLVRNADKLAQQADRVEIVEGNYLDSQQLKLALAGSDAVLSTVGPLPKASPDQTTAMYIAALDTIFTEMKAHGISRFVNILGAATEVPGDKSQLQRKIMGLLMGLIGSHLKQTKQAEYEAISQSGVAWTAIRPGMITKTAGEFVASADYLAKSKVDVTQLANFMLNCVGGNEWVGQAPLVATV